MAWTDPRDWAVGELPSAVQFNQYLRDNLKWVVRPADIKSTEKEIVNSAAAADLLNGEITIPAGYMGTNGSVYGFMMGDYLNHSGSSRTLSIAMTFGATTIYSDTSGSISASTNRHNWWCEFTIANLAATNLQFMMGEFYWTTAAGATTGIGDLATTAPVSTGPWAIPFGSNGTFAEDTTAAKAITFTAQHNGTDPELSIRLKYASFELKGQAA